MNAQQGEENKNENTTHSESRATDLVDMMAKICKRRGFSFISRSEVGKKVDR